MKDDQKIALLKSQLQNCLGWESDALSGSRADALNYYFQRPRGDEVAGRSGVVSGDVSASVEANLAQMLDAYTTDNIAEFDPLGPEDEDQAQLETETVLHFVMKEQNGYIELAAATKDALLLRNGILKVRAETVQRSRTRTFDNVDEIAVEEILTRLNATLVSYNGTTLVVRETDAPRKRLRVECVPPENFLFPKQAASFDLQEIPFCAERHEDTRSRLLELGFPKAIVSRLKPYTTSAHQAVSIARDPVGTNAPPVASVDPSLDLIEWFEAYPLADFNGDGIAERRYFAFTYTDGEILEDSSCSLVPYTMGVTLIMPHRLTGISDYDKLRQNQDEQTGLKRALYDNVNAVTKNRLAYLDGAVNSDDVGDGRPNGGIRVDGSTVTDVRAALMALQVPDNSGNVLQNINALKAERSELGGASLELATGQLQIGGDRMGSQGLDRAYSVMEQLSAMKAKTFASTLIRGLFLLAHATLREHFSEPVAIKRGGRWTSAVPAEWPVRDRVTVRIGMSPGERARRGQALMTLLDSQLKLTDRNMDEVLVDAAGFYRLLMDWARVNDVPNPEQYYIDPESERAQQAFAAKAKAAQEDASKRQALMTQAVGIEQIRTAIDKYKADQTAQYNYWKAVLDAEVEEAKIVGAATADLIKSKVLPDANGTPTPGSESERKPAAAGVAGRAETSEDSRVAS